MRKEPIKATLRDLSEMKRAWEWIKKDIEEGKIIIIEDEHINRTNRDARKQDIN